MMPFLPLVLMLFGPQISTDPEQVDHPRTYLASIVGVPLNEDEHVEGFSITTWGVTFQAVCHIPSGWTLTAGGSLTPEGELNGEGSLGVSWFNQGSPPELENLGLVTLYAPVQKADKLDPHGSGVVPATFKGTAQIATLDGERTAALDADNVRLVEAEHCPQS